MVLSLVVVAVGVVAVVVVVAAVIFIAVFVVAVVVAAVFVVAVVVAAVVVVAFVVAAVVVVFDVVVAAVVVIVVDEWYLGFLIHSSHYFMRFIPPHIVAHPTVTTMQVFVEAQNDVGWSKDKELHAFHVCKGSLYASYLMERGVIVITNKSKF